MRPAIAISYALPADETDFEEFLRLLASGGTQVDIERRAEAKVFADLEWLIPTAIIVFVGKAYIDGFVKELGKDHYALLKRGLKSLYARFVGPKAPAVTVVSSVGKSRAAGKYSLLFSLLAEASDGVRFKLLIQTGVTEPEYEAMMNAFLVFLADFHHRTLSSDALHELRATRVIGKTLLLAYDFEKRRVVPVDPMADSKG